MKSKLEIIRVSRGLSQRKLEDLSGVSQQTISRIEKGTPLYKANTAAKLARVLNCRVSDIMDSVDAGIDNLSAKDFKNINTIIRTLRILLKLNPRKCASMLNMEEQEYLEYENGTVNTSIEEGLQIISVLIFMHSAANIGNNLKNKQFPKDTTDEERRLLKAMRAVEPEQRERIINYFQAAQLLKF